MLFPDFEKFAFLRRAEEPYTGRSAHEYRELAHERLNVGKYDEAVTYCDRAIDQDPDYAETYYLRGCAKHYQKQYSPAISDFDKFISLNPNYVDAYHYRAEAKFGLGDSNGTREDLEVALLLAEESGDSEFIDYIEGFLNNISEITAEGEQDE